MGDPAAREVVTLDIADFVATITLNRPERLNAMNRSVSRALYRRLDEAAQAPEARVIVITGAGRGFCAGADTKVLDELADGPKAPSTGSGGLRFSAITDLPKPVIAAVNGPCAGVGFGLACTADIRLASSEAFFVAPFASLGLTAETALGWLLPRLVGTGNALDMLMSGRRVTAAEALAMGLVSHLFPQADFTAAVRDYATTLARSAAPAALMVIKRQVYDGLGQDFATAAEDSFRRTRASLGNPDFKEAMAAKREKREPRFTPVTARFHPEG